MSNSSLAEIQDSDSDGLGDFLDPDWARKADHEGDGDGPSKPPAEDVEQEIRAGPIPKDQILSEKNLSQEPARDAYTTSEMTSQTQYPVFWDAYRCEGMGRLWKRRPKRGGDQAVLQPSSVRRVSDSFSVRKSRANVWSDQGKGKGIRKSTPPADSETRDSSSPSLSTHVTEDEIELWSDDIDLNLPGPSSRSNLRGKQRVRESPGVRGFGEENKSEQHSGPNVASGQRSGLNTVNTREPVVRDIDSLRNAMRMK